MTLTDRVSLFFLAALAAVLGLYSVALYWGASYYLHGHFEQELRTKLLTLAAAVEAEEDDIKWQPAEHNLELAETIGENAIQWTVIDGQGRSIDQSPEWPLALTEAQKDPSIRQWVATASPTTVGVWQSGEWHLLRRDLVAPSPKPASERDDQEFDALSVLVLGSTRSIAHLLRWMLLGLIVIPCVIWLIAAIFGRSFCRRSLRPLHEMAESARTMGVRNRRQRLPISSHGDELAGLAIAFNAVLDELQAAFEKQKRFTGDAAHQLRTPLAALEGQVEVALRRPRSSDEYQKTLRLVSEQSHRLAKLVRSLLFLARSNEESILPELVKVELSPWLSEYFAEWDNHPRRTDLFLRIEHPVSAWAVPELLHELVDNLVGNALKYSEPASPVEVIVRERDRRPQIVVWDQGIGVASKDREAIFEPFYRSEEARRRGIGGSGLGLSIAARIARVMGGKLQCVEPTRGSSEFILQLNTASSADEASQRQS